MVSPSTILTPPAGQSENSTITVDTPPSRVLDMDIELNMPKDKRKLDALFSRAIELKQQQSSNKEVVQYKSHRYHRQ